MTFEQTMHTIESHLEALQAEYDRLLEENNQLKESILRVGVCVLHTLGRHVVKHG